MTLLTVSKRMVSSALTRASSAQVLGHDVRPSDVINNEFKDIDGLARCKPGFMLTAATDKALVGARWWFLVLRRASLVFLGPRAVAAGSKAQVETLVGADPWRRWIGGSAKASPTLCRVVSGLAWSPLCLCLSGLTGRSPFRQFLDSNSIAAYRSG